MEHSISRHHGGVYLSDIVLLVISDSQFQLFLVGVVKEDGHVQRPTACLHSVQLFRQPFVVLEKGGQGDSLYLWSFVVDEAQAW